MRMTAVLFCLMLAMGCTSSSPELVDEEQMLELYGDPLGITESQVPTPGSIPFTSPDDIAAYLTFYRKAYLFVANHKIGGISTSCCLGDVPNRKAKINGHYAGQLAAHKTRMSSASLLKE